VVKRAKTAVSSTTDLDLAVTLPSVRPSGSAIPSTKLGVAPPGARPSKRHPVVSQSMPAQAAGTSRTWLALALLVMLAGVAALVVVLAQ
jgi:hypothetical protein